MVDLSSIAKLIILAGAVITAVGLLFLFSDKIPWLGRLPGDIYFQKKGLSLYFPITTCIIVSILLSVIFYFITRGK